MRESRIFIFLAALLTALSGVQAYVPQPSEFTGALASAVITFFPQIDESITDVEIATPTIAEWSCGRLFAGRFTRGYVGVKTAVPVFDGGWIGCHYNPVNFTDPTGMWEWDNDLVQKGIGGLIGFYGWEVFKSGWTAGLEAIQIEPNPDDPITPFLTLASFGAFPEVSAGVQSAKTIIGPKISPYVPKFSGKLSKFLYGADDVASQLATDTDEAVFWSGIRNGETAGAEFVSANGGATLETTLAARGVKLPVWDTGNPATVAAWRNASAEFAAGAKGNIRVLQSDAVRVNSVWAEVEFPALKANPNVNSITAVNPKTGEQILLWSRK